MSASDYAGDVTSAEAWDLLSNDPKTVLVDVRTQPEWTFVGIPDLRSIGKEALMISWQVYPGMEGNSGFMDQLRSAGVDEDATVLFMCRSGARSRAAAIAATAAGYRHAYNVADGFEGGHDESGHRGRREGWKAANLPWTQN